MVADIGTKRIMDPHSWLKALYLINIATPKVWDAKSLPAYYNSQADDGLPMKPGGISRPVITKDLVPKKKKLKQKRLGKSTKGGTVQRLEQLNNAAATPAPVQSTAEGEDFTGGRLLIEYCCSAQSELGRRTRQSAGCSILRLTEKEDMTNPESVSKQ